MVNSTTYLKTKCLNKQIISPELQPAAEIHIFFLTLEEEPCFRIPSSAKVYLIYCLTMSYSLKEVKRLLGTLYQEFLYSIQEEFAA